MGKLYLYSVFHLNLSFSSIPESDYPYIIKNCYQPLLDIAESGIPIAIEASGSTLREIERLSPSFINRLARLWEKGSCEFIGSGLSQLIMPLVPAEVNQWNLEYGGRVYERLLGRRPTVALVGEQTYSKGIADLFVEAGYKAIIMDWNNCYRYNQYPKEYLYAPQAAEGLENNIDVLWNNSIAFQKFQRFVHGSGSTGEYMDYLASHHSEDGDRSFVLYGNDGEVFDYRPGTGAAPALEMKRLKELLIAVAERDEFSIVTPSMVLEHFRGKRGAFSKLRLESVENPLVCKKQEKYNPVRWAVTGRDSVHMNAACHGILKNLRLLNTRLPKSVKDQYKEALCELWGSDFRTNTIDEKFLTFQAKSGWLKVETERLLEGSPQTCCGGSCGCGDKDESVAPLVEDNAEGAGADALVEDGEGRLKVSTSFVEVEFLKDKGFAIGALVFPGVSPKPLVGTLAHGFYDDIGHGADYFSSHLIHVARDGVKTTDLEKATACVEEDAKELRVCLQIPLDIGVLFKEFVISKEKAELEVKYRLKVTGLEASSLRLGIFTFMPDSFESPSLYYESVNGGKGAERFLLDGSEVAHDAPVSQRVSASGCLGATEGWIAVGDAHKEVRITTDKTELYSVPMVNYRKVDDKFFLRIYHSIGEIDETAWWVWRGDNHISFRISAVKKS